MWQPKRISRILYLVVLSVSFAGSATADDKPLELLQLPGATIEQSSASGTDARSLSALTDGKGRTSATVEVTPDSPFTIVYGFGGQIVTLDKLIVTLPAVAKGSEGTLPSQVDLLVSTVSARGGFYSVRTDPLKNASGPQEFRFAPAGAKWVMLRFSPRRRATQVSVAEISLLGHKGPPVSHYKFRESPAKAFDVLRRLKKVTALDVSISPAEASLFADAQDGRLDKWSFREAALLASGVTDPAKRKSYVEKLAKIEAAARQAIANQRTPHAKGEALLKFLHDKTLTGGYVSDQTSLAEILDSGKFNCVSSATLYNIIGRRLGLNLRAIEVPEHAFSILYDGTQHADVETTTPRGFNPARDAASRDEFEKLTGFNYIHDSNRGERREIGDAGLVAIIYYNRGVDFTRKKQYQESLYANFRAMSMDPEFHSAVKNALAALANWGLELAQKKEFESALEVINTGLALAPEDATLVNNHKALWSEWANSLIDSGKTDDALAVLKRAAVAIPKGDFVRMQAWVFIHPGEEAIKKNDWNAAFAVIEPGLKTLDDVPRKELQNWAGELYIRWSSQEIKAGRYESASNVIERGLKAQPKDTRLANQIAYVGQEWAKSVKDSQGEEAAKKILLDLAKRFPSVSDLGDVSASHVGRTVRSLIQSGKYSEALASIEKNSELLGKAEKATNLIEFTYDSWARKHLDAKEWQSALDVYAAGLTKLPRSSHLENNAKVAWANWAEALQADGKIDEALTVLKQADKAFPKADFVKQQAWIFIGPGEAAIKQKKWENAIAAVAPGLKKLDEAPRKELEKWASAIYIRWSAQELRDSNYDAAVTVIEKGLQAQPDDSSLVQQLAYAGQEWAKSVGEKEGDAAARKVLLGLMKRFPKVTGLTEVSQQYVRRAVQPLIKASKYDDAIKAVETNAELLGGDDAKSKLLASIYDQWASISIDKEQWQAAIDVYAAGLKKLPKNDQLQNNAVYVWNRWARKHMDQKEWDAAIDVLERGLKSFPGNSTLTQNVKYCQQEKGRAGK